MKESTEMKRYTVSFGVVVLGFGVLLTYDCHAGPVTGKDKSSPTATAAVPAAVQSESEAAASDDLITVTTGTRLPQKVRKTGQITDGANCLTVIDQKTIAGSGAGSVAQVLRRVAGVRVSGP